MSLIDSLNSQFKSLGTRFGQQIQESQTYQQAQDRYQNMSPTMQKVSVALAVLLVASLILLYPLSKLTDSRSSLTMFEEKRGLIRDLFRTYRESASAPNIAIPPTADGLQSAVDSILSRAELLPEQRSGIFPGAAEGRLIPQNLVSNVLQVKLAKLNLRQVVDIGSAIAGISESVKMKDLLVTANRQDTRYFDVTYILYSLKVPEPTPEAPPEIEKPAKKSRGSDK